MARPDTVRLQRVAVLKAMAHPSRLLMLETLTGGERCVCDLQRVVGADLSTVSKHLSRMRAAGLVTHRKLGLQVFYRLSVPCVLEFLDCVDAVREGRAGVRGRPRHFVATGSTSCPTTPVRPLVARRAAARKSA